MAKKFQKGRTGGGPQGVPATESPISESKAVSVPQSPRPAPKGIPARKEYPWWLPLALSGVFFLLSLFASGSPNKWLLVAGGFVTIAVCLPRFSVLSRRLTLPSLGVCAWVLMNGVSQYYAISGAYALREFLKIALGFCLFLVILAWSEKDGPSQGRLWASALSGGTAIASLVSIDLLSTHLLSGPVLALVSGFSDDYNMVATAFLEPGVRMNSLYESPNVYAGIAGIGVLLGLELAITATEVRERRFHLVCLYLNALAFLLVFSMGASATIGLAFLVFLLIERPRRRGALLILMVETFLLVLAATVPIYLTAFGGWNGFQPVPLLCAAAGAALLCVLDRFVGGSLSERAAGRGKRTLAAILAVLVVLGVFAALSVNLTGAETFSAGETLRRADYPAPGTYTLSAEADGGVTVTIQSQDTRETMMHTSTILYSGEADGAEFTVPEGSRVVYFNLSAAEGVVLRSVTYSGPAGEGSLKLRYWLLPGFIANRLQGLFANENAIQRTVFFQDGMKLFQEAPLFGQGLGTFDNAYRHVQSFYYVTRYVHNHYIQTLDDTGIVGLILFVGMLALLALAVIRNLRENGSPLAPCLGAALVFMAAHCGVEVVFSESRYLLMALGIFGVICVSCGGEWAVLADRERVRNGIVAALAAMVGIYGITVYMNLRAQAIILSSNNKTIFQNLELADKLDLYEWKDAELSYVFGAKDLDRQSNWVIYTKAMEYADKLSVLPSNTMAIYLADFYFATDQQAKAFGQLEKHVTYMASSEEDWQYVFQLLETYHQEDAEYTAEVAKLYQWFEDWQAKNMGTLTLTEENRAYLARVLGSQDSKE